MSRNRAAASADIRGFHSPLSPTSERPFVHANTARRLHDGETELPPLGRDPLRERGRLGKRIIAEELKDRRIVADRGRGSALFPKQVRPGTYRQLGGGLILSKLCLAAPLLKMPSQGGRIVRVRFRPNPPENQLNAR
jgi:hypothetical protein